MYRLAGSATGELPGTESLIGQLSAIITLTVAGLDGTVVEGMIQTACNYTVIISAKVPLLCRLSTKLQQPQDA